MSQAKKNKEFILRYVNCFSGKPKTREMLEVFNADAGLVDNILFFESVFPRYEYIVEEMVAEGDRVIVRARLRATHEGEFLGIPPTHKKADVPFVVGYEITNDKIIHSWLITDYLQMTQQLK